MNDELELLSNYLSGSKLPALSAKERRSSRVLIVDSDIGTRHSMRQSLLSLGYGKIQDVSDLSTALERLEEAPFHYVVFEAKNCRIPAKEFLTRMLEIDRRTIAIPSSYEPTVDDVFDLLIMGARGFVVKPFTCEALDESIIMAAKGEPISESVLHARSRNEALASLVLSNINRTALIIRQARQFETAKREIQHRRIALRRAVEIGKVFAKGGAYGLREAIISLAIKRSDTTKATFTSYHKRQQRWKELKRPEPAPCASPKREPRPSRQ